MAIREVEKGMMAEMDQEAGQDSEVQQWRRCWQGTGRALLAGPRFKEVNYQPKLRVSTKLQFAARREDGERMARSLHWTPTQDQRPTCRFACASAEILASSWLEIPLAVGTPKAVQR